MKIANEMPPSWQRWRMLIPPIPPLGVGSLLRLGRGTARTAREQEEKRNQQIPLAPFFGEAIIFLNLFSALGRSKLSQCTGFYLFWSKLIAWCCESNSLLKHTMGQLLFGVVRHNWPREDARSWAKEKRHKKSKELPEAGRKLSSKLPLPVKHC